MCNGRHGNWRELCEKLRACLDEAQIHLTDADGLSDNEIDAANEVLDQIVNLLDKTGA